MQNLLLGGIACLTAALAMIAAALYLTGDDEPSTVAIEPLAGQIADDETGPLGLSDTATIDGGTTGSPVTIAAAAPSTSSSSSTSTTASTTTSSVTITSTSSSAPSSTSTEAVPSTAAPSTSPSSPILPTTAESTSSTDSVQSSSTTSPVSPTTSTAPTTVPQTTVPPSSSTTTAPAGGSLNAVEQEIARLTNELRTNPNGPLKRQGPVIDCGGRIRVDGQTNRYEPIAAVAIHEVASLQVARPWSAQMTTNLQHRPRAGVPALEAAGISVWSAGENIAYHNYPDKALNHFVGWRESDGHFCNMMDPGFTHLGVGEVTKSSGISYATQNFFSIR